MLERGEPANLGNWAQEKDVAECRVGGAKPGRYAVSLVFASPEGGSRFALSVGGATAAATVPKTGAWRVMPR